MTSDPIRALSAILDDAPDARWNFPLAEGSSIRNPGGIGAGTLITYSFHTEETVPLDEATGFRTFSDSEQAVVREILAGFAAVANLEFQEVSSGSMLEFGMNSQEDTYGYAYYPSFYYETSQKRYSVGDAEDYAGGVWLSGDAGWDEDDFLPGGMAHNTLIHEIGHALGLKHPFESDSGKGFVLRETLDHAGNTVMSYNQHPYATLPPGDDGTWQYLQAETLMPFDIQALQYLYGANETYRTDDDLYTFDPARPFIRTLWDGAGNDTISAEEFTTECTIDLRMGRPSSLTFASGEAPYDIPEDSGWYDGTNNLFIAQGTIIENALGGSSNDLLIGNSMNNTLTGNDGNDTLYGGKGLDILTGGAGADAFAFDTASGSKNMDTIADFTSGIDELWLDDRVFAKLAAKTGSSVAAKYFVSGLSAPDFRGKDHFLCYNEDTGILYYDRNGDGAGTMAPIAVLTGAPALAHSDIWII